MEKFESLSDSIGEEDITTNINVSLQKRNFNFNLIIANSLKKHNITIQNYENNKINNIIFDEKKKIVSLFKDNLLWNEPTELLRR